MATPCGFCYAGDMFVFQTDAARRSLRIILQGYWDADTMARYEETLQSEIGKLRARGGCKALLIDLSRFPIQSKEIIERHQALLARTRDVDYPVAILAQDGLSKLQTIRVAASAGTKTFNSEEEAQKWLFGNGA